MDSDTIQQIYAEVRRIADRLDRMAGEFVPRQEYEKRREEAFNQLKSEIDETKRDLLSFKQETTEKQRDSYNSRITIWIAIIEGIIAIALHFWK